MIREQAQFESERRQLFDRAEDAFRRLKRLELDETESKSQKLQLLKQISTLEDQLKTVNELKNKGASAHEAQMTSLTQKYETQIGDLTKKIELISETHTRTCQEMQQLLTDQRRLGEKW